MLLKDVIAAVESSNHSYALQFEISTYERMPSWVSSSIPAITQAHSPCSWNTGKMIASTSFGKYQMMGFNLYDTSGFNYKKTVAEFLTSPDDQDAAFSFFLTRNKINYTWEQMVEDTAARVDFITKYNGPGDIDNYWALMQREANNLESGK